MRLDTVPWVLTAFAELGEDEVAGTAFNPRIAEYLSTVNQPADDEIPWYAAFVNWCLWRLTS